jgi:hypothetical protein
VRAEGRCTDPKVMNLLWQCKALVVSLSVCTFPFLGFMVFLFLFQKPLVSSYCGKEAIWGNTYGLFSTTGQDKWLVEIEISCSHGR